MQKTEWFNRKFPLIDDNGVLPAIIERLSGTPARIEEIVSQIKPGLLTFKLKDKWTIKEEIGHLSDLEPLWLGRLHDLINNEAELRVTDLTNQLTHKANHDATEINVLLLRFREKRRLLVNELLNLDDKQLSNTALHPRLKTPMRIIDLAYFVAEHDDHHLASVREIMVSG
ncbi:DinB family protein [Mucilaginibacter sp. BJC16-A38]|uniref:DinB family protein n=1 Tax=Mucilaginibacter phenanthrenivorans TaxID=1234842 RepID=UPI0021573703|nr:DinB family protein [Mucilaginibacter phenanthrenivorans]MCR8561360.1 DinB family protein [Mucilaginibacter phenanthrenivorans]